jgi:hypothetical protein
MKNLSSELIAKAKAVKSAEELLALAKANNVELTEAQAKTYFAQLSANGAVADEELEGVSGGGFLGLSCPEGEEEAPMKLVGKKVRLLNGKKCVKCHGNEGIVSYNALTATATGNALNVSCPKCNLLIASDISNDDVEVL